MSFANDETLSSDDLGDHVINHIFGCGMTLAGIVAHPDLHADLATRLLDVIDGLDMAVSAIRQAALRASVADRALVPDALGSDAMVIAASEPVEVRAASNGAGRRLCRFADEAFAYSLHGHDFYRTSDHVLWAQESDGLLLSARTGLPFARRDGYVFFDLQSDLPIYYEDSHTETAGPSEALARASLPILPSIEDRIG